MTRRGSFLFLVLTLGAAVALVPACSGLFKDRAQEKNYDESDWEEYRDALPDVDSMTLSLPESGGKGLGDLAVYYEYTVDFTREVNEHVLMFLSWIDEITSYPPSDQDGDTLIWGPWHSDGLSPVDAVFAMTKVGERTYDYVLSWRPKDTDDAWTPIWTGHVVAKTDTARRGVGDFAADFTAAKSLDPTIDSTGQVAITYDTFTDGREIEVQYVEFYNDNDDMAGPVNGVYAYHNHADNTGEFLFDWGLDIHWDQYHGTQYAQFEHGWFNTRWQGNGAGRADVVVTGGDLPDLVPPIARIDLSECWGSDFLRDYYGQSFVPEEGAPYEYEEGDEASCVFDPAMPQI
jgi:hypothetical protein